MQTKFITYATMVHPVLLFQLYFSLLFVYALCCSIATTMSHSIFCLVCLRRRRKNIQPAQVRCICVVYFISLTLSLSETELSEHNDCELTAGAHIRTQSEEAARKKQYRRDKHKHKHNNRLRVRVCALTRKCVE